jgi:hypothetical protein
MSTSLFEEEHVDQRVRIGDEELFLLHTEESRALHAAQDSSCGFSGDPCDVGELFVSQLQVDLDAAVGRDSLLLAKLVEGRADSGVRVVKGQHFNLSPGIAAPPAQHLEHGSIDTGMFEHTRGNSLE